MLHANPRKTISSRFLTHFVTALALIFLSSHTTALNYCAAKGSYSYYEYIKSVSINNVTSTSTAHGYFLFASPIFQLNAGNNPVALTPGFSSTSFIEGWSLFVDLNQDGNFSTDERLLPVNSSTTVNNTLVIPATAKPGPTRMRIVMQYPSYLPIGCGTFYYGEVEDYTVNIGGVTPPTTPPTTPPPTKVSTTTTAGYDRSYNKDLVVNARFSRDGVVYNSSNFYYANSTTITRPITFDVYLNTKIEWTAQVYLDDSPAGVLLPANCKTVTGTKCLTVAGAVGESVLFKEQPAAIPPVTTVADLSFNFDNMFAGATYKVGPTIDLGNGVSATTTAPYFYNSTGAPFNSAYFAFSNLTLNFSTPVLSLTFKAAGSCTNCAQTVTATADGLVVSTFILNYDQITPITITLPSSANKISFTQNFKMDDLSIDLQ